MAGVTPKQIWDALEAAGASTVQAIGIMANMINESSLDPESSSADPNASDPNAHSYGLVQENGNNFAYLVTGNPQADMQAQINYLTSNGGLQAAAGSTPAEAAGNFAARYERCVGCQPGGSQYNGRVANAATVAGWANSGQWPQSAGQATDTAATTTAQSGSNSTCAWQVGIGFVHGCIISKPQARALIGAGILTAGLGITVVGAAGVALAIGLAVAERVTSVLPGVGKGVSLVRGVTGGSRATRAAPAPAPAPAPSQSAPRAGRPRTTYTRNPGGRVQGRPRVAAGATSRRPAPARP